VYVSHVLRNLPQIDERIGLLVAQETININHQRLRRVNVHVVAVLWTFQVRIRIHERFRPDVRFGFDALDIFLFSARSERRSAETGSSKEDVDRRNYRGDFKDCPPSK
jgi:hypothetical protein